MNIAGAILSLALGYLLGEILSGIISDVAAGRQTRSFPPRPEVAD